MLQDAFIFATSARSWLSMGNWIMILMGICVFWAGLCFASPRAADGWLVSRRTGIIPTITLIVLAVIFLASHISIDLAIKWH